MYIVVSEEMVIQAHSLLMSVLCSVSCLMDYGYQISGYKLWKDEVINDA